MTKNKLKLITHSGSFHADDAFACATLILYLEKNNEEFSAQDGPASGWEIIRTRDPEIIKSGDYVFDVGGIYDEENNRFDHHQKGGVGRRVPSGGEGENGIEYSSFGLVWKKFGVELCGSQKVADLIDQKLVCPIDAGDNGFDLVINKHEVTPYYIQHMIQSMRPTWREGDSNENEMFFKSVTIAKEILSRELVHAKDEVLAENLVISAYNNAQDKRIIALDKNYPSEYFLNNFPEPLYVIYPREVDNSWGIKAVRADPKTFKNRKDFPKSWAGLKDEELQQLTDVKDAIFCHRALFLAVAKSKEGAIKLAELALLDN